MAELAALPDLARGLRSLPLALALLALGRHPAAGAATTEPPAAASQPASGMASQYLRVESSFWDTFGVRVSKAGRRVGPSLLSVLPDEVVAGSAEARRHAVHARVFQGFTLGLGLGAVGSIAAGAAERAGSKTGWNTGAEFLVGGGVLALFGSLICASSRQSEMLEAINAYNFDLVSERPDGRAR